MQTSKFVLTGLSLVFACTQYVTAETKPWHAESFTQTYNEKGTATGDYVYEGVKVTSMNPDEPELRFGCSERFGLTATVTFLPVSQADPKDSAVLNIRQISSNLKIEGRDREYVPWTWVRETRTVQTRRGKHAAMIYNAVLQNRDITIKEPMRQDTTITPPPVNEDFRWFAKNCPVTSGS